MCTHSFVCGVLELLLKFAFLRRPVNVAMLGFEVRLHDCEVVDVGKATNLIALELELALGPFVLGGLASSSRALGELGRSGTAIKFCAGVLCRRLLSSHIQSTHKQKYVVYGMLGDRTTRQRNRARSITARAAVPAAQCVFVKPGVLWQSRAFFYKG